MNEEMELKSFLLEALKERFKADTTVRAIEKEIEKVAKNKTFKKYRNVTLVNDGMEFELIDVKARLFTYDSDIIAREINLQLYFFCKSKLPKRQTEKLKQIKEVYERDGYLPCNYYKKPIAKQLYYSVDLDKIISGEFNLVIE
jgi:hypothetical protein